MGHFPKRFRGRLARGTSRAAHRLADLPVAAGARVTGNGRGDLPNARGSLAYPGHVLWLSAIMGWLMGRCWLQIAKPQLGGMAERTNATVLKTVG